ncbi:toxic anion resistance protein [Nitratifractor sp.]
MDELKKEQNIGKNTNLSEKERPISLEAEEEKRVQEAMERLDPKERSSVIRFGSEAQAKLDEISNRMIEGVKNKETAAAGESLNRMVAAIRGFDIDALDPNKKLSWWEKLLGKGQPLALFIQRYEEVRNQLDVIAADLERHKAQLTADLVALDKLYEANLDYFRQLELYIEAGERKLRELEETIVPEYEAKAESGEMLAVQELRELRGFRDDLERRVHDLRLSRQVAMQALPAIRLIQENDKSLIAKIDSTLVNTVPLWRNQLAQTVTIFRSREAAGALRAAGDLTNDLLEANAESLRQANAEVRTQMERGVFDIESIKKANRTLIATLDDSLRIAEEGKKARRAALEELQKSERELKNALLKLHEAQKEGLSSDKEEAVSLFSAESERKSSEN